MRDPDSARCVATLGSVARIALALASFGLGACATTAGGGGVARGRGAVHLEDARPLEVAGPRCVGAACSCRAVDATGATVGEGGEAPIVEGMKRFELRTGRGSDEVQITVAGRGTLHKAAESIDAVCGYIDLPPGEHRLRVRVKAATSEGGAAPKVLIYEYGQRTGSWYASFGLSCGESATCTHGDLEQRLRELVRPRGLFDPCGSVKIAGLRWEADKAADERVTSLDLELVLKVHQFTPRFPRGGTCKGLSPE